MTMRDSIAAARISGPVRQANGESVFEFRFGADDPTFAGHFPGRPLLPGVFQLEMARAAAEWVLGCSLGVSEVWKAKFMRPILPNELVRVCLELSESGGMVHARADFSVCGQRAGETALRLWRSA
jgi:3-hydroxymyristoyl/3-hydroxydecanoyl-(acyl carrier protein) dehydratase